MKVLITAPSLLEFDNVSGISTVVRQTITAGSFHFVHFQAGSKDGEARGFAWMIKQIYLPFKLLGTLRRERPDLVNINTSMTTAAIVRDAMLSAAASIGGKPIVLSLHGGKYLLNEIENFPLAAIARFMLNRAKSVVVLGDDEAAIVARRWPNLRAKVLPNAVSPAENPNLERIGKKPILLFLGRLHESKGLNQIVAATRAIKESNHDIQFRCFGDGPEKVPFVRQMEEVLAADFHYGGVTSGTEKMKELADADIFLLPSLYGEGLPMAMLEAMAAGCVSIVSDLASVRSVIIDGQNGFLVEPGNISHLVERLSFVLDNNQEWVNIRKNAVNTIESKFSLTNYVKKLETIYQDATVE